MDVLVIGRNCVDYIAVAEQLPVENTKAAMVAHYMDGGGQGGTSACAIARLGGSVTIVGKVGDDSAGEFCRRRLESFGVACDFLETVAGRATAIAHIWVTAGNGNRTILYAPNELPPIEGSEELAQMCGRTPAILLDPEVTYLAPFLADLGHARGLLIYDAERWRPGMEAMMVTADLFVPTAGFLEAPELGIARGSWVQRLNALRRRVGGQLVVTRGADGAYLFEGPQLIHIAAPKVAVADTTGAGDVFHGALALALSEKTPLPEAVKIAVAAASLACRGYGGRETLADMQQVSKLAKTLTLAPAEAA